MNKPRKNHLDLLRVLAAMAVLIFHVVGSSANNDPNASVALRDMAAAFNAMLQWHVPVFFTITGYLWLSSEKECTFKKVFSNIKRFGLVLFTFGLAYAIMARVFTTKTVSIACISSAFLDVLNGSLWDHMWFVYSIIGVYLVLPVLKPFFDHSSLKSISGFAGLLFVFTILLPIVKKEFNYSFPVSLPIAAPMFYICFGGMVSKWNPTCTKTGIVAIVVFGCSMIAALLVNLYTTLEQITPLLNCISASSLFLSATVFMHHIKENKLVRSISDCSFGIYLIHPFFINLMIKLFHIYPMRYVVVLAVPVACIVIAALSFVSTYILRKVRWIKEYIL